jgi:hypothetical protein
MLQDLGESGLIAGGFVAGIHTRMASAQEHIKAKQGPEMSTRTLCWCYVRACKFIFARLLVEAVKTFSHHVYFQATVQVYTHDCFLVVP